MSQASWPPSALILSSFIGAMKPFFCSSKSLLSAYALFRALFCPGSNWPIMLTSGDKSRPFLPLGRALQRTTLLGNHTTLWGNHTTHFDTTRRDTIPEACPKLGRHTRQVR